MWNLPKGKPVSLKWFKDDGTVPNSTLPVIIYRNVLIPSAYSERAVRAHARTNLWKVDWVDTDAVYKYTHYHSRAHEVLLVINASAVIKVGGKNGEKIELDAGDAIAIPAGVAHRRMSGPKTFTVAGLYPAAQEWDLLTGHKRHYADAKARTLRVPLPMADPFYGKEGPLKNIWDSSRVA